MHTHARRLAAAVLPLALVLTPAGGDGGRAANFPPQVSDRMVLLRVEPDELTKYLHAAIQEVLKDPAPGEMAKTKVRAVALLIASQAQNGRGARDGWQRVALRDNALRLLRSVADGQIDAARRQAANFFDMARAQADARPVALKDLVELDEVESLMKLRRRWGLGIGPPPGAAANRDGIELRLMALARKAPTAEELDADAEHLARAALVTAAMADLLDAYTPDKKVGNKEPKDWKQWTGEMRAASEELEGAARAKDAKGLKAAATRLTRACADCHSVFRD
jgi:hypothetical protein